jgi:hypothetical protein
MKSLSCLLPRKSKKGRLYAGRYLSFFKNYFYQHATFLRTAPKPIARHIIISAQPAQPSTTIDSASTEITLTNPPREKYPPELLTHRFMPYGSLVKTSTDHDDNEDESEIAKALRMDSDVAMSDVDSNIQSNIVAKEEHAKKGRVSKKKKDKKLEEEEGMEVDDTERKEKLTVQKEKKSSGKKRKGEEAASPKKTKKAKTAPVFP